MNKRIVCRADAAVGHANYHLDQPTAIGLPRLILQFCSLGKKANPSAGRDGTLSVSPPQPSREFQ